MGADAFACAAMVDYVAQARLVDGDARCHPAAAPSTQRRRRRWSRVTDRFVWVATVQYYQRWSRAVHDSGC